MPLTDWDHLILWEGEHNRWYNLKLNMRLGRLWARVCRATTRTLEWSSWFALVAGLGALAFYAVLFVVVAFIGNATAGHIG